MRLIRNVVMMAMAGVVACGAGGCLDQERLIGLRQDAAAVREELASQAGRLEAEAGDEAVPIEVRAADQDAADAIRERLTSLDSSIAALDQMIDSEQNPEVMVETLTRTLVPILPEPLRSPLVLLGALGVSLARAMQLKRAAGSIAKGIAKVSEKDDAFRTAMVRHADTFRAVQTPAAKRIVDEKTRPGFMLRLPV